MEDLERIWRERGLREAVLTGDEQAWRLWYEESFAELYRYVLWRSGGMPDQADELVQEVWLTVVKRLESFDPARGSFAGWLRGIASQVARNHYRRQRRCSRIPPVPTQNSREQQTQRERAEQVARTLAELPEHYEAVLRDKYLDGLDLKTMACQRGTTVKAIESLLVRAREAFRAIYDPEG